jgi:hypothetical protein
MFVGMGDDDPGMVVALRERRDGWTAARQRLFLEVLADTGSVTRAARRVGMSREAAYRLRRHPAAVDFAVAWDLALLELYRRVEEVALERVLQGEEEEVLRDGAVVVVRRRPCDVRLLLRMLERADANAVSRAAERAQQQGFLQKVAGLADAGPLFAGDGAEMLAVPVAEADAAAVAAPAAGAAAVVHAPGCPLHVPADRPARR